MQNLMKKGISPLIATILIIGFTVALAAVIMTWGQSFTKSVTKGTESSTEEALVCAQDVKFEIKDACVDDLDDNPLTDDFDVLLTISNDGNKKIEEFAARFYTAANDVQTASPNVLAGLGLDAFAITSPAELVTLGLRANDVKKVEVIPLVKVGENVITCANSFETFGESDLVNGPPLRDCS